MRHSTRLAPDPCITVIADHSSAEHSRSVLAAAAQHRTRQPVPCLDGRHFTPGGTGVADLHAGRLVLRADGTVVTPDVVIVYEIPPEERARYLDFQTILAASRVPCLDSANAAAWHAATDKTVTLQRFAAHGIPHAQTAVLHGGDPHAALTAFQELGHDVWTRPATGMGGTDVFHADTEAKLLDALRHYATAGRRWLMSRDAGNLDAHGRRRQFRVVVLHERVLRVCLHVQNDPDLPCNESRGAVSTVLSVSDLPPGAAELAVAATRSLGLAFGGVDLCTENGGSVFEVNLHPLLNVPGGLESICLPLVDAHLTGR